MTSRTEKARYLLSSLLATVTRSGMECPSCGGSPEGRLDAKYGFTHLDRCGQCKLLFRSPTTSRERSQDFYQFRYAQGSTTELPDEGELARLKATGFAGEQDFSRYIDILSALGCVPGAAVFDFGCSWGYGSWQLARHGFRVQAFEISVHRAAYARNRLGVDVVGELDQVKSGFDVFFSAHVLEHVPSVRASVAVARRVVRPGGLFVAFTPNGAMARRAVDPLGWHAHWGQVHPQLLDDVFYRQCFPGDPRLLVSEPYPIEQVCRWAKLKQEQTDLSLTGSELLCVVVL